MKKQNNKLQIFTGIIAMLLLPALSMGQVEEKASLDTLIEEASHNNSKIKSAYHQWQSAEYKIKSAQSLDDPALSYGYFGEEIQTRVGPQEQKYGVTQKIPFPGKRRFMGKAQAKQAAMLKKTYEATRQGIIQDVKFAYFDLFWIDQAIQISEEEKSILERLENVAQRKYESNQVSQQDVIKVQVELSKIIEKLFLFRQNRLSTVVKLNRLLNRDYDSPIDQVQTLEEVVFDVELDSLMEKVQNSRQELLAAGLLVEKAEAEHTLAKMSYLPDFTFGAEYMDIGNGSTNMSDDGKDAWLGKISVNVPIWFGKLRAQVKEKEEALIAAEQGRDDIQSQVEYEVQDVYFKINAYKDIVLLYETALLPQAQQAFEASQTGFETGSISFLDWLDTERTFLQTRLAYYKSITDYHKSIAYLERVVGGDVRGGQHEE